MSYSPKSIVVVSVVMPLIAVVAVFLRFLLRLKIQPAYVGIDDWLVLGAVIFLLGDGSNLAVAAILGLQGRDYPNTPPEARQLLENRSDYAQTIIEKPMYAMIKLSILFFYRRIFTVNASFRAFNTLIICLTVVWAVAYTLVEILECGSNPSVLWTPGASMGSCVNRTWMNFSFAITDVIGDLIVVLMPFPMIQKLNMNPQQEAGVAAIFVLGLLSTVAAIIRLGFITIAFTQNYGAWGVNLHETGTPPDVWSTVEGGVGATAACLPPLGPLLQRVPQARKVLVDYYHTHIKRSSRNSSLTSSDAHQVSQLHSYRRKESSIIEGESSSAPI